VRQKSRRLSTTRIVALENGQQIPEVRLRAEFLDQANVGFDPVVLTHQRPVGNGQPSSMLIA
jgi:hypothetical protein